MTPERHAQLQAAYLFVFGGFAVDKRELAEYLDVSPDSALTILKRLESAGIVYRYDVNEEAQGAFRRGQYKMFVWQCSRTYDDFSHEEALGHFLEVFPAP